MGGAASQDSYHHGRALQLVVIHARKLRTKTRHPGYLKQESWSAQLAGEQERSQISLPGFGFTRSSISCASVGAADALARLDANPKRHASKQRQNPPNVYSYLTGPELESAIRGCTAVAAAYTSVPPARIVQSWQFEQ